MLKKFAQLAVVAILAAGTAAQAQMAAPEPSTSFLSLQSKAVANGGLPVVVELAGDFPMPADDASAASDAALTATLVGAQAAVASSVLGADRPIKHMSYVPMFAATVTADEIARLAADPRVARVIEDGLDQPFLNQSLRIIKMSGAGGAYTRGANGRGRAVAVLDTGVDKRHEFLRNKVIAEACYSTSSTVSGSTSLCRRIGPGNNQGLDCAKSIQGCGHGTHVAGISAGRNTGLSRGEPASGVARNSSVVAVQVFSKFSATVCGGSECVASFVSDQMSALEYVYSLRNGVKARRIDAVNMSLGGGRFTGFCNTDPRKQIIDLLRRANIATVIASGNNGYVDAVAAPACIQSAITVGSSTKSNGARKERMSSFTNQGPQVDVLAPGGDVRYPFGNGINPDLRGAILSSFHKTYEGLQGTSMAAPHVAGAIAAIRSRAACRNKPVAQIERVMGRTGPLITDHRKVNDNPQLKERRLDVPALMKALRC